MLSVLIPVEHREPALVHTLASLVPGVVAGLVRDVSVLDYGQDPDLERLCDEGGCHLWRQSDVFQAALQAARSDWVMVVPAGLVLIEPWQARLREFFLTSEGGALLIGEQRNRSRGIERLWRRLFAPRSGVLIAPRSALLQARIGRWSDASASVTRKTEQSRISGCAVDLRQKVS
ncbi:hypothetical protein [Methylovirgula sp. 4M-Z18]|uniref:hypothetical protein n=1 Tax=Methylovirgula sp. 4M-Z18 TaxID=2293567 RepID=UPI000E2EF4C5|nr:hypothetical protein [Methylovirgula sp. 4M-Z18]RFB78880.1 hypothetical protein DYH55_13670 [Methylovirgula sp. 4M-Z18]